MFLSCLNFNFYKFITVPYCKKALNDLKHANKLLSLSEIKLKILEAFQVKKCSTSSKSGFWNSKYRKLYLLLHTYIDFIKIQNVDNLNRIS